MPAFNPASLNLVRPELSRLINQATAEFELATAADSPVADLGPCQAMLAQADGVLRLVELADAAELARAIAAALVLPLRGDAVATDTVARGLLLLSRYLDYLAGRREAVPELLLEEINAVRAMTSLPALDEARFSKANAHPGCHCPLTGQAAVVDPGLLRRLRHLYQVGLLGVIRGRTDPVHLRLMQRATDRMLRLSGGGAAGELWWLLGGVLEGLASSQLRPSATRNRLLSRADRVLRELGKAPETAVQSGLASDYREPLMLLVARCRDGGRVREIQQSAAIAPLAMTDRQIVEERSLLTGTSAAQIDSMVRSVEPELQRIRTDMEPFGVDGVVPAAVMRGILGALGRINALLRDGGLRNASSRLEKDVSVMEARLADDTAFGAQDLLALADAVVQVETAVSAFARTDAMAGGLRQQRDGASGSGISHAILDDARLVLLQSARECLEAVKHDISAFADSRFDPATLTLCAARLGPVRGALNILEHPRAASIAGDTARVLAAAYAGEVDVAGEALSEAVADVLICLEYYIAAVENAEEPDPVMLGLASESLGLLGVRA